MSLAVFALVVALQAPPEAWVFTGGDADGGFAVDRASLRQSESTVTAWVMAIPNRPMPNYQIGMADYVLTQTRYDCAELTLKDVSRFIYRTDGTLAHSTTGIPDAPVAPPPGSTGAAQLHLLCTPGAMDAFDTFSSRQAMRDAFRQQYGSR